MTEKRGSEVDAGVGRPAVEQLFGAMESNKSVATQVNQMTPEVVQTSAVVEVFIEAIKAYRETAARNAGAVVMGGTVARISAPASTRS